MKYGCTLLELHEYIVSSVNVCDDDKAVGSVVRDLPNFRDGRCNIAILQKDSIDFLVNELTTS